MIPMGVDPPRTRAPFRTVTSVPAGKSTSTREPNRINPINSPFATVSPTSFQHMTRRAIIPAICVRSEEHTSELQSQSNLVCRLLLEKKKNTHVSRSKSHIGEIPTLKNVRYNVLLPNAPSQTST